MEDYTDYYRFTWLMKKPPTHFPRLALFWLPVTGMGLFVILYVFPQLEDPSHTIVVASQVFNAVMGILILAGLVIMTQSIRHGLGPSVISCSISKQGLVLGNQVITLDKLKHSNHTLIERLTFNNDEQRQRFEKSLKHYLA